MKNSWLIILYLVLLSGCFGEPSFSEIPEISLKSLSVSPLKNADSVVIILTFRDGDGDLGLVSADTFPPYQVKNNDGTVNKFHYNYFIDFEKKVGGKYEKVTFLDNTTYYGRFTKLNTSGVARPLEGDLRYLVTPGVGTGTAAFQKGDTVRLLLQIADRALHESNLIITEPFVAGVKK